MTTPLAPLKRTLCWVACPQPHSGNKYRISAWAAVVPCIFVGADDWRTARCPLQRSSGQTSSLADKTFLKTWLGSMINVTIHGAWGGICLSGTHTKLPLPIQGQPHLHHPSLNSSSSSDYEQFNILKDCSMSVVLFHQVSSKIYCGPNMMAPS